MTLDRHIEPRDGRGAEREELKQLLKRWIELREVELDLLRRFEALLVGEEDERTLRIVDTAPELASAQPEEEQDPLQQEILRVLEQTFPPPASTEAESPEDTTLAPSDVRLLLVHLAADPLVRWYGVPWHEVASVRLPEGGADEAEGYEIVWTAGRGVLAVSRIGKLVDLDAAAGMGVEEALVPAEEMESEARRVALIEVAASAVTELPDRSEGETSRRAEPRGGPCAVLLVRYLPARVALARILRGAGWSVIEEPDPEASALRLEEGGASLLVVEAFEPGHPGLADVVRDARDAGIRVVEVGSRYRTEASAPHPHGDLPRLLHPFAEGEVEELLERLSRL